MLRVIPRPFVPPGESPAGRRRLSLEGEGPLGLDVVLLARKGRSILHREAVTRADLLDHGGELWWEGFARKGRSEVRIDSLLVTLEPHLVSGEPRDCTGFTLHARAPRGLAAMLLFSRESLGFVAQRGMRRLVREGRVAAGETALYELRLADPAGRRAEPEDAEGSAVQVQGACREAPPRWIEEDLAGLLSRATSHGHAAADSRHAVFFTPRALRRAEEIARRGESFRPPVESGGVLIGVLARCPETGEAFLIVGDALEATDAEQKEFSLSFTGGTWAALEAVMHARSADPSRHAERILGQVHGHNFLPGGRAALCAECSQRATCARTTAFLSDDDLAWSRAVFAGEPWQLGMVCGRDARGTPVATLYGLLGARLQPRGYHVLDARDAARFDGPPSRPRSE